MTNVLIADLFEESAWLLRAILRGRRDKVSVATRAEDALDLLETGMYDLLLVDLTTPVPDSLAIVQYARKILPGMPIVAVTNPSGAIPPLPGVVALIRRPIDGPRVKQALAMAAAHLDRAWINRRSKPRSRVDVPIMLRFGDWQVPGRTFDMSEGGAAVVPMVADPFDECMQRLREASPPIPGTVVLGARDPHDPGNPFTAGPIEVSARVVAMTEFGSGGRAVWNIAFGEPVRRYVSGSSGAVPTLASWMRFAA
ncbi:MAG: PilZ domain-containing protein [Planctomycetota bacterium]